MKDDLPVHYDFFSVFRLDILIGDRFFEWVLARLVCFIRSWRHFARAGAQEERIGLTVTGLLLVRLIRTAECEGEV